MGDELACVIVKPENAMTENILIAFMKAYEFAFKDLIKRQSTIGHADPEFVEENKSMHEGREEISELRLRIKKLTQICDQDKLETFYQKEKVNHDNLQS
ncbi:hypothetical protein Ciccas_010639 [Cichlidogyrus casuarinus]|uniref:Uncharacterized protein n=1 Tax=Cichlidogyrus casuarinus TaxID=1844966 RepID=A0ABD2PTZ2_9PLAT